MGNTTLVLDGPQTISTIEDACARLKAALALPGSCEIDLSGLTEADVAFAQLLLAARKSADHSGTPLTILAPTDSPIRSVFSRAGLDPSALLKPAATGDQP